MPPRFFYFDMGNVLLTFDYTIACRQLAEVAEVTPQDVHRIIFDTDLQQRYETGLLTSREFFDQFCTAIRDVRRNGHAPPDYDALRHAGSAMFEINLPLAPIILQLRSARNRLGILSNTCECHWDYCHRQFSLIRHLFDVYMLSYEAKSMKPDRAIFEAAAEMADADPAEIFFVDDRRENIEAARAAGYDAVQYTSTPALVEELRGRNVAFNY